MWARLRGLSEYDVHGLVGVRLVGATPRDEKAVDRQLGPVKAPLDRDPDVIVRFVDRVEVAGDVRLLGTAEAGFSDDAYLVLRSRHKARARVRLDLARVGAPGC